MRSALPARHLRSLRRPALVGAVAVALLVLASAGPAASHPFFREGETPVDSLASLTLELGHGCGTEGDGGADSTEVALEVPGWMRVIALPERSGWETVPERDAQGHVEVVIWRAVGAAEAAPTFEIDVVVSGEPGDERFVSVFQACGDVVHRWVGTPDEPADEPAISLTLVEADPERPAPPEPAPAPEPEPEPDADEEAPTEPGDDPDAAQPPTDAAQPPTDGVAGDDVAPTAGEAPFPWVATAAVVLVLAVGAAWNLRGRRRPGDRT